MGYANHLGRAKENARFAWKQTSFTYFAFQTDIAALPQHDPEILEEGGRLEVLGDDDLDHAARGHEVVAVVEEALPPALVLDGGVDDVAEVLAVLLATDDVVREPDVVAVALPGVWQLQLA